MGVNRIASICLAGALSLGITGLGSAAFGADMPVLKAPPASPWVFDVHGFVDFTVANSRVTGGGMLLYPTSSTIVQPSMGVSLDIYKNSSGFINSFSAFVGISRVPSSLPLF